MTSLASLATELLIQIVDYVSPLAELPSSDADANFPTLKNLSLTCRRLHSICFHRLFASLRLNLQHGTSAATIAQLRAFTQQHQLQPTISHLTITFGRHWNATKNGLSLKKLLWELRAASLTLTAPPGGARADRTTSVREKSARWSYGLDTVRALKVCRVDDSNELKMLLLRACPAAAVLVVEDGCFRAQYERRAGDERVYFDRGPMMQCPGVAMLKPGIFPNLARVVYAAAWPSYQRVDNFLAFVCGLPALRELGVTLMGGEDAELNLGREGYRLSGDAVRYREVVTAYSSLTARVERGMEGLRVIRVGDVRVPWRGEVEAPRGWLEDFDDWRGGGELEGVWRNAGVAEDVQGGNS